MTTNSGAVPGSQATSRPNRPLRFARLSTEGLQRNGPHSFARQRALAIYGMNAVYSFIPKNACSTLRYSIAIHNGYLRAGDNPDWIHNNNSAFVAEQRQMAEADYTFVVLRCPFRRLASAFLDKIVNGLPAGRVLLARSLAANDMMAVLPEHIQQLSFVDFARICMRPPAGVADFHWFPQVNFLVYEDYDDWFSVEAFGEATRRLESRGLRVHDTRNLLSHSTVGFERLEGPFARVPASEIFRLKQAGQLPTTESLFDDEAIALVRQYYADDIALYAGKIGRDHLMFPG